MANASVTIKLDKAGQSVDAILASLQAGSAYRVVINGPVTPHALTGEPTAMFTYINIPRSEFNKLKQRKALKGLKQLGAVQNWG